MSETVKNMFSDIASEYDFLNDILSFRRHRKWKRKFVKKLNLNSKSYHLDIATGTGDIVYEIVKQVGTEIKIKAVDFSERMIINANLRKDINFKNLEFEVGDATNLRFDDNTFDSVSISFGIRNIPALEKSIKEMTRVIKPGGIFAIMEFGTPDEPFNMLYKIYSKFIMPYVGKLLSGNDFAYTYLPETIKKFPYGDNFRKILMDAGEFRNVEVIKMEFGTVYSYYCYKK